MSIPVGILQHSRGAPRASPFSRIPLEFLLHHQGRFLTNVQPSLDHPTPLQPPRRTLRTDLSPIPLGFFRNSQRILRTRSGHGQGHAGVNRGGLLEGTEIWGSVRSPSQGVAQGRDLGTVPPYLGVFPWGWGLCWGPGGSVGGRGWPGGRGVDGGARDGGDTGDGDFGLLRGRTKCGRGTERSWGQLRGPGGLLSVPGVHLRHL